MLSELTIMDAWAKCLHGYKSLGERLFGFAREIEAEVRKQDEALIRQMLEALQLTQQSQQPAPALSPSHEPKP